MARNQKMNMKLKLINSVTNAGKVMIISFAIGLVSCSEGSVKLTDAPSRNNTEFSRFVSKQPIIKTVSADTYRVCDAAGCSNRITRKTDISNQNYLRKKVNVRLKNLKPPVDSKMSTTKTGRGFSRVVSGKRSEKIKLTSISRRLKTKSGVSKLKHTVAKKRRVKSNSNKGSDKKSIIGIRFRYNQSTLSKTEERKLDSLVKRINRSKHIGIAGYIDNSSPLPKSRQKLLASKRAIAIARYLKDRGISAKKLKIGAYGYCCFGSVNDATGVNNYYRRAEIYFNHRLLLRDASIKNPGKLVSGR